MRDLTIPHSESNKSKNKAGQEFKLAIREKLESLKSAKQIADFKEDENIPHKGFVYSEAYLANFVITTRDSKFIIVRTTSSFRDRYKSAMYDLRGIYENSEYADNIVASIFLLDNKAKNDPGFDAFRQRIRDRNQYVPFTHCHLTDEFVKFLEIFGQTSLGSQYGKRGHDFVRKVISQLNDKERLLEYRCGKTVEEPFGTIVDHLKGLHGLGQKDIIAMRAFDTIKVLKSGGNAKTDFYVELTTIDNKTIIETVSVKRTSNKVVTCHEYPHEKFVSILNCRDSSLERYLKQFEDSGSFKNFESAELEAFEGLIKPHVKTIAEWAIGGKHDTENIIDAKTQIASHILINNGLTSSIKRVTDYTQKLLELDNSKRALKTPFTWTRSSNNRSTIQLKMPVLA